MTKEFFDTATLILGKNARKIVGAYSIYLRFANHYAFSEKETMSQCISIYLQCRDLPIVQFGEESCPLPGKSKAEYVQFLEGAFAKVSEFGKDRTDRFPIFTPEEADIVIWALYTLIDSLEAYRAIVALIRGGDLYAALGENGLNDVVCSIRAEYRERNL